MLSAGSRRQLAAQAVQSMPRDRATITGIADAPQPIPQSTEAARLPRPFRRPFP